MRVSSVSGLSQPPGKASVTVGNRLRSSTIVSLHRPFGPRSRSWVELQNALKVWEQHLDRFARAARGRRRRLNINDDRFFDIDQIVG
jgi:plasmid maintenance system antidote protein VapI